MKTTRHMTPFDVILVPFPFSDLSTVKKRPCLVLCVLHPKGLETHFIVSMMTSSISRIPFPYDVVLQHWKQVGLPKQTIVRLAKMVTIDSSLIGRRIGRISSSDRMLVQRNFHKMFQSLSS